MGWALDIEALNCYKATVYQWSTEFGVVRLYRTFSNYIFTQETRCAGCFCTSLSASNLLEPHRSDIARCVESWTTPNSWEIILRTLLLMELSGLRRFARGWTTLNSCQTLPQAWSQVKVSGHSTQAVVCSYARFVNLNCLQKEQSLCHRVVPYNGDIYIVVLMFQLLIPMSLPTQLPFLVQ